MFAMYRRFQSQETSKLLLWFSLNVLHRNFFMCFIIYLLIDLSTLVCLFWFDPYTSFWKITVFQVFGLLTGPLMCSHVSLPISNERSTSQCNSKYFHLHCKKCRISCFVWANPCPSTTFNSIFLSMNWHCVMS
jgi:hypothetical protein